MWRKRYLPMAFGVELSEQRKSALKHRANPPWLSNAPLAGITFAIHVSYRVYTDFRVDDSRGFDCDFFFVMSLLLATSS